MGAHFTSTFDALISKINENLSLIDKDQKRVLLALQVDKKVPL